MSFALRPIRAQTCLSCLRRKACPAPIQATGTRRMRSTAGDKTIPVRLLRDTEKFGPTGAIVPLARGRMRNEFFPRGAAEYITKTELKELGLDASLIRRDYTFGVVSVSGEEGEENADAANDLVELERAPRQIRDPGSAGLATPEIKLDLVEPARASELLEELLPPNIDFYKQPIEAPAPTAPILSPSIPRSAQLSAEAQKAADAAEATRKAGLKVSIYGSVTTADILSSVRAVLDENAEAARISLSADDIVFMQSDEDNARVKHLGVFAYEIRVRGSVAVKRTIKVNAQT